MKKDIDSFTSESDVQIQNINLQTNEESEMENFQKIESSVDNSQYVNQSTLSDMKAVAGTESDKDVIGNIFYKVSFPEKLRAKKFSKWIQKPGGEFRFDEIFKEENNHNVCFAENDLKDVDPECIPQYVNRFLPMAKELGYSDYNVKSAVPDNIEGGKKTVNFQKPENLKILAINSEREIPLHEPTISNNDMPFTGGGNKISNLILKNDQKKNVEFLLERLQKHASPITSVLHLLQLSVFSNKQNAKSFWEWIKGQPNVKLYGDVIEPGSGECAVAYAIPCECKCRGNSIRSKVRFSARSIKKSVEFSCIEHRYVAVLKSFVDGQYNVYCEDFGSETIH